MPRTRWMTLLALLAALALAVAACAEDEADDEPDDEPEEDTEEVDEPEDDEDEAAEETEDAGDAEDAEDDAVDPEDIVDEEIGVSLDDLCEQNSDIEPPEGFRIGLITDIGSIDDGTFNTLAFRGVSAIEDCFDVEFDLIETQSEAELEQNIDAMLENDPDVVVTNGFLIEDATAAAAEANPDVDWIGVDQFQEEFPENYVGIQAREDQGGYLAGTAAGLLTESNVIGVIGGPESVPPIPRFANAYQVAAERANPDVTTQIVYHDSFTDPAAGASTATAMLGEGADVIMGAGGATGSGGIREAADQGAWVIGVDVDEYFTTFGEGETPGADRLVTSALKRIDVGIFELAVEALDDSFEGRLYTLTVGNGGIAYSATHDADVPQEVLDALEETLADLEDDDFDTGVDPVTGELLE